MHLIRIIPPVVLTLAWSVSVLAGPSTVVVTRCAVSNPKDASRCERELPVHAFSTLGFPSNLTKQDISAAIQTLATAGYDTAFRHLGLTEDWDHGHILRSSEDGKARAIIFHTQEKSIFHWPNYRQDQIERLEASLYETDGLLAGLNPKARSWIYFFSDRRLYPAEDFRLEQRPADIDAKQWDAWIRASTYTDENIDPHKVHFEFYGSMGIQIERVTTNCAAFSAADLSINDILSIEIPANAPLCLHLRISGLF